MSEIRTGVDVVYLPEFKNKVGLLSKAFHASEQKSMREMAGIFSLKECCIKALDLRPGSWLDIEVKKKESGKPYLSFSPEIEEMIESADCSISHDKDYLVSIAVFLLKSNAR